MIGTEIHNFNTLYTKFYRKSFLFTKSYVHDECIAEDIVSDVLIKLWEILKEKEIEHIEALLLTTLKNKSLDHLKHEAVKTEALHTLTDMRQRELDIRISTLEACNPEDIFSTEVQQIVTATLALLPEQTRRVFEMSRFENKTNKEIAEELQLTVKGVEYHITKALKPLRENLKDYLPLFYFYFFFQ
ncbi:RNA polymerase sigma-70 factor [Parabacteroides goldsteinii]|uniref:RNA polymerase n=2 Tax=Parabacteroides goldsteinii TaxID=328812 RepID=A0A0J6CMM0_9BACT|nr:RNA polymerase sigma-70 factor [Parabacteroides goldsteinii]KKB57063.1 RNA polymerase sigma-70 factor [Parabacteroides goldsteinii DSM 19448 = WAL 12034]KMM34465.1 RNA polymerase [Parabacteroides goldsteinii]